MPYNKSDIDHIPARTLAEFEAERLRRYAEIRAKGLFNVDSENGRNPASHDHVRTPVIARRGHDVLRFPSIMEAAEHAGMLGKTMQQAIRQCTRGGVKINRPQNDPLIIHGWTYRRAGEYSRGRGRRGKPVCQSTG